MSSSPAPPPLSSSPCSAINPFEDKNHSPSSSPANSGSTAPTSSSAEDQETDLEPAQKRQKLEKGFVASFCMSAGRVTVVETSKHPQMSVPTAPGFSFRVIHRAESYRPREAKPRLLPASLRRAASLQSNEDELIPTAPATPNPAAKNETQCNRRSKFKPARSPRRLFPPVPIIAPPAVFLPADSSTLLLEPVDGRQNQDHPAAIRIQRLLERECELRAGMRFHANGNAAVTATDMPCNAEKPRKRKYDQAECEENVHKDEEEARLGAVVKWMLQVLPVTPSPDSDNWTTSEDVDTDTDSDTESTVDAGSHPGAVKHKLVRINSTSTTNSSGTPRLALYPSFSSSPLSDLPSGKINFRARAGNTQAQDELHRHRNGYTHRWRVGGGVGYSPDVDYPISMELYDQLSTSPQTRFHAVYLFRRFWMFHSGDSGGGFGAGAANAHLEGYKRQRITVSAGESPQTSPSYAVQSKVDNGEKENQGGFDLDTEGRTLVAWDIGLACLALSVKYHRDFLYPLAPVYAHEFCALAGVAHEDLESAHRDVLAALDYRLGDSPQALLAELRVCVDLDMKLGRTEGERVWNMVLSETWRVLLRAVRSPDVLRTPLSLLTGAALILGLLVVLRRRAADAVPWFICAQYAALSRGIPATPSVIGRDLNTAKPINGIVPSETKRDIDRRMRAVRRQVCMLLGVKEVGASFRLFSISSWLFARRALHHSVLSLRLTSFLAVVIY
ncbi:hypothetical protein H0H81_000412 [Sphagnurus paluster]|uniref:Uncharacterized protein n=1 Tax=Sphagnurus paluster TaxID=117069 RepID=A0A9P7GIZ4_9AGAR|nr:hypothetical protein H0H81_000412 [Sphagnurus paluster]